MRKHKGNYEAVEKMRLTSQRSGSIEFYPQHGQDGIGGMPFFLSHPSREVRSHKTVFVMESRSLEECCLLFTRCAPIGVETDINFARVFVSSTFCRLPYYGSTSIRERS